MLLCSAVGQLLQPMTTSESSSSGSRIHKADLAKGLDILTDEKLVVTAGNMNK